MTTNEKLNCYFKNFVKKALMSKPAVAFKSLAIYEESFKSICEITAEEFAKELKNEHGNTISWTAEEADNKKVCSEKCVQALTAHTIDLDQHVFDGFNEGGITGYVDVQYGYTNWHGLCLPWHYPYGHSQARYHTMAGYTWAYMVYPSVRRTSYGHNRLDGFKPVVYHNS